MIRNIKGFVPVRGSSSFAIVGSASSVLLPATSVILLFGFETLASMLVLVTAVGLVGALKTISDCLRGFGVVNSESASDHSVIAIHWSERALMIVIVYDSHASRRSTRVTERDFGISRIPVRLSTLIFVPSDCFAMRIRTDSITIFCVKFMLICVSSSTVTPLKRSEFVLPVEILVPLDELTVQLSAHMFHGRLTREKTMRER